VLDSTEYGEGQAAWHLEKNERVISFAKNDRLDLNVLYEWEGSTHPYIPDFLVRLKMDGGPDVTLPGDQGAREGAGPGEVRRRREVGARGEPPRRLRDLGLHGL
jgi:hypothetical protein